MKNKYRTLIISSWAVYFIYLIIKLLGGRYFELECENEKFIIFCNWLDNDGQWLTYIIYPIMYMFSNSLVVLSQLQIKIKSKLSIGIFLSTLTCGVIKQFIYLNPIISILTDLTILIGLPFYILIFILKEKITKVRVAIMFISIIAMLVYQSVSLILKSLVVSDTLGNNSLVAFILSIDYYIMLVLHYLYMLKERKGVNQNG